MEVDGQTIGNIRPLLVSIFFFLRRNLYLNKDIRIWVWTYFLLSKNSYSSISYVLLPAVKNHAVGKTTNAIIPFSRNCCELIHAFLVTMGSSALLASRNGGRISPSNDVNLSQCLSVYNMSVSTSHSRCSCRHLATEAFANLLITW